MKTQQEIYRLIDKKKFQQANIMLDQFLSNDPSFQDYVFAEETYRTLSSLNPDFTPIKLAIVSSFTLEPVLPVLKATLFNLGYAPDIYLAGYNQIAQEILNSRSHLFNMNPDIIIIAARLHELHPKLVTSFLSLDTSATKIISKEVLNLLQELLHNIRKHSEATIFLHNFEIPAHPALGIIDSQNPRGQTAIIRTLNERLVELTRKFEGVFIFDYDHLQSVHGRHAWPDPRMWYFARMPLSYSALIALARAYTVHIHSATGNIRKCLVLDADNTLWGGIIGEEGMQGIQLGPDYPGNAYVDFQQSLLNLHHRGILLALNSRNDHGDVFNMLEKHPFMILRPEHFAAMQINWNSKHENMEIIAKELNISLDSFVFLDDSPFECENMHHLLPKVLTLKLPEDPGRYPSFIHQLMCFDTLALTDEDRNRGKLYQARIKTGKLRKSSLSLQEFYLSLHMKLTLGMMDRGSTQRITQLIQRTSQFNLTSRRYSEADIQNLAQSPNTDIYWIRLEDRFGDNGIIGVVIIKEMGDTWKIDTFLLSCRILGRTIEETMLIFLSKRATQSKKINTLTGEYIPTAKNRSVCNFYPDHHFKLLHSDNNHTLWQLLLKDFPTEYPEWFKVFFS